ncbi:Gfo/Idh/MocA family oxidoreductase [Dyadobacter chenwenxiniae]|uniref:Gfo/Idh/MocA family oxidoreductase n=1 Tax=Dyadobacter chenwenxiniae TaxID=2906456 RepID=A0A9X1PP44_9BACT|nr:Gfo/Idh/MocA family oxidoreductase [Dyadobacter chenwenxiniae]MCF0064336.1 Gfo/Idh/MocA family oxidoreductase [Dyadobacter chenwenxiniae]UON82454.1 Gfo/Idh/MocA family oxidoreductase [Dyadobacter chenwenxiniae]
MPILKAAIIGGGHIADQNHIPALKSLPERVELIAVCSRDILKARALADKHAIPLAFDNAAEMFESENKPDMIINCTANNLHYPFTMQALENNCHVLCEKPPAMNAAQALEMADLAKERGKVLAYNFQLRHTPEYSLLKRFLENGRLGEVYHIKANFLRRRGIPSWGNFTNKSIQGGGALMDLGVHVLDLALGLLDYSEPDRLIANTYDFIGKAGGKGLMGSWDPEKFEVEDACFAHLSFPNNASITLSASFALNTKMQKNVNLEVFGTKAGAVLNPFSVFSEVDGELLDMEFPHLEEADIQLKNTIAFLNACDGKSSNICDATQGAILQKIVEAIYKSAEK